MTYRSDFADGILKIFADNGEDEYEIAFQDSWPDGTSWGSEAEALAWADVFISLQEGTNTVLPGFNPENPTIPIPEPEVTVEEPAAITE